MLLHAGNLFSDAARQFADRAALEDGTSYRELDSAVSRVASGLASLGISAGERVGVLSHNRPELIAIWLGLERAGLVRVVLHSHFDVGVHADMLERTAATALLFDTRFAAALQGVAGKLTGIRVFVGMGRDCPDWAIPYGELLARGNAVFEPPDIDEDAPVCIQPTTGTTGMPKPWTVSHRAWAALILHNLIHLADMAPFGNDEVNLHVHALPWASGAQTLLPYMLHGAQTIVIDDAGFDPSLVADAIKGSGATGLLLPGPMLGPVLDAIEVRPGFTHRLRRLVTLFATPELLERTTRVLGPVWCHGYGSTEQGAPVTRLIAREAASRPASVGRKASPLIELAVVGSGGRQLPAGHVGEIVVRSPMSSSRYWDDPARTERAFSHGQWFHSGDLGFLDEDGFLTYVDRSHDAIPTRSGYVYPHEVEAAVQRHPAVASCGAVGLGGGTEREVVAAVLLKPGHAAEPGEIAAAAADALPVHAQPRVVIVSELPVVLGGAKVQRDVLRRELTENAT
ncbi:MAG: class I adenylate-forming enzyme family protein [Micromonosporaceae bacterium]